MRCKPIASGSNCSFAMMAFMFATEGLDRNAMARVPRAGKTFLLGRPMRGQTDARVLI
jgi:hypothetical protein